MSSNVFNELCEVLDRMHSQGWEPEQCVCPDEITFRSRTDKERITFRFQVNDYSEMLGEEKMTATVREWDWSDPE